MANVSFANLSEDFRVFDNYISEELPISATMDATLWDWHYGHVGQDKIVDARQQ